METGSLKPVTVWPPGLMLVPLPAAWFWKVVPRPGTTLTVRKTLPVSPTARVFRSEERRVGKKRGGKRARRVDAEEDVVRHPECGGEDHAVVLEQALQGEVGVV